MSTLAHTIDYHPPLGTTDASYFVPSHFEGKHVTLNRQNMNSMHFVERRPEADIASSHGFEGGVRREFKTAGMTKVPELDSPRKLNSITVKLKSFKVPSTPARKTIVENGVVSLPCSEYGAGKTWRLGSHVGEIVAATAINDRSVESVFGAPVGHECRVDEEIRVSGKYTDATVDSIVGRRIAPDEPEKWYTKSHVVVDADPYLRTMVESLVSTIHD
jgi:hypothetical protein